MNKGTGNRHYVEKVPDSINQFTQDLLQENRRLRALTMALEVERNCLQEEKAALQEQLEGRINAQLQLQQELAENEAQRSSYAARYMQVEEQNSSLASLYVTSYRLHSTMDRQEVLTIIQEVIINLVGSEELAIFEMSEDGEMLRLIEFFGINPDVYAYVPLGAGAIGQAALSGEIYIAAEHNTDGSLIDEEQIAACIPLKLDGRVTGVIAVFNLLGQKTAIEFLDRELFDLLAIHAAAALYCTSVYAAAPVRVV